MKLIPIIDHLQQTVTELQSVDRALQLTPFLDDDSVPLPSAWLHPWEDDSARSPTAPCLTQQDDDRFGVMIAAPAMAIARNGDGSVNLAGSTDELEDIRELVRDALSNQAFGNHEQVQRVGGAVLAASQKVIWWRDVYRANRLYMHD